MAPGSGPSCTPSTRLQPPWRPSSHGRGLYNVVDDEPAPVAVWLPELARLLERPEAASGARLGRWLIGGDALVRMMTQLRGSSNAKAKAELGWVPQFPSWRHGIRR